MIVVNNMTRDLFRKMNHHVAENDEDIVNHLASIIENISEDCLIERDAFFIGISGGSVYTYLANALPLVRTDWGKWTFVLCDERYVPLDHEDSIGGRYLQRLLTVLPRLQAEQILTLPNPLPPTLEEAASSYSTILSDAFGRAGLGDGDARLDCAILGMGPDGHTCSLFPGHTEGESDSIVTAVRDSPKPPPERISLTYRALNAVRHSIFVVSGIDKADMVKTVLHQRGNAAPEELPLPAARIKEAFWLLDRPAASLLDRF